MGAFVKHKFPKGFILDEEKLRKIYDILTKKSSTPKDYQMKVYRNDSYQYTTDNLEDILIEENAKWQRIFNITFEAKQNESFKLFLVFEKEEGAILLIEGDDRDFVFLLFSDLRNYIQHEVATHFFIPLPKLSFMQPILGIVLILVGASILIYNSYILNNNEAFIFKNLAYEAISSNDTNEKINLLIKILVLKSTVNISSNTLILGFMYLLLTILILLAPIKSIHSKLFYTNLFLIGKEKERYENRNNLKEKFIWVIIAGFIISIIAGLIVWKITI